MRSLINSLESISFIYKYLYILIIAILIYVIIKLIIELNKLLHKVEDVNISVNQVQEKLTNMEKTFNYSLSSYQVTYDDLDFKSDTAKSIYGVLLNNYGKIMMAYPIVKRVLKRKSKRRRK